MISIIIPIYNCGFYLRTMIDSILAQSYRNWELILVDDGSKDNSGEICEEYAAIDNRIHVIHQQNAGVGEARNTGLRHIHGDYVYFADSDDRMEPEMLQRMIEVAEDTQADIVRVDYWDDYVNVSVKKGSCDGSLEIFDQTKATMKVYHNEISSCLWTMLFRRNVIRELFPDLKKFEDFSITPSWFLNCKKFAWLHTPYYHYRQRQGSIMNPMKVQMTYPRDILHALTNRYNTMTQSNLIQNHEDDIVCTYQRDLIRAAKNAVRSNSPKADLSCFVEEVLSILKKFPHPGMKLGFKYSIRYSLLVHSPRLFQSLIRCTGVFSAKNHKNEKLYAGVKEEHDTKDAA